MGQLLRNIHFVFLLIFCHNAFSVNGSLFDISSTGTPVDITGVLCLNGIGPMSCQHYVAGTSLIIRTTRLNHTYPVAGIKINTPGFMPKGCKPINNGYCLFSVSNTIPASIFISKNSGYTIGGSISGLTAHGLVLQNNGGDNLALAPGATSFQFSKPVAFGGSYHVTVQQQPIGLTCTVSNGSGTNVMANVTNISITCSSISYAYVATGSNNIVYHVV